jgi:hypothetical protein
MREITILILGLGLIGCMGSPQFTPLHGGFTGTPPVAQPTPTPAPASQPGAPGFYVSSGGLISTAPQVRMRASVGSPEQGRLVNSASIQGYIKIQQDLHDNL